MKVKDRFMIDQDKCFQEDVAYKEYLEANYQEPSVAEINQMEKNFSAGMKNKCEYVNNMQYQPLVGA